MVASNEIKRMRAQFWPNIIHPASECCLCCLREQNRHLSTVYIFLFFFLSPLFDVVRRESMHISYAVWQKLLQAAMVQRCARGAMAPGLFLSHKERMQMRALITSKAKHTLLYYMRSCERCVSCGIRCCAPLISGKMRIFHRWFFFIAQYTIRCLLIFIILALVLNFQIYISGSLSIAK